MKIFVVVAALLAMVFWGLYFQAVERKAVTVAIRPFDSDVRFVVSKIRPEEGDKSITTPGSHTLETGAYKFEIITAEGQSRTGFIAINENDKSVVLK